MDTFSRVIILLSVVSLPTASFGFGMGFSQQYIPDYISPLVQECLLFDLEALINSNAELTPAQETVIRCYYTYCQNIMNMAQLVSDISLTGGAGGAQSMSSNQYDMQQQAQAQSSQSLNMQQQSSGQENLNAQLTSPTLNSVDSNNMGS